MRTKNFIASLDEYQLGGIATLFFSLAEHTADNLTSIGQLGDYNRYLSVANYFDKKLDALHRADTRRRLKVQIGYAPALLITQTNVPDDWLDVYGRTVYTALQRDILHFLEAELHRLRYRDQTKRQLLAAPNQTKRL